MLPLFNTVADLQQVEWKMTDTAVRHMIDRMKTLSPMSVEVTLPLIKLDVRPDMHILIKKLGLFTFQSSNPPAEAQQLSLCIRLSTKSQLL